jgi:hypothetical protein
LPHAIDPIGQREAFKMRLREFRALLVTSVTLLFLHHHGSVDTAELPTELSMKREISVNDASFKET